MELKIYGTNTIKEAINSGNLASDIFISEKKHKNGHIDNVLFRLIKEHELNMTVKNEQFFMKEFGNEALIKGLAAVANYKEIFFEDVIAKNAGKVNVFYVILDDINDPQNLGSIIRTANCAGADCIILPKSNSVFITSAVANVSQGAVFYSDVVRVPNIARTIENLKALGIWVIGLSGEAEEDIYSFKFDIPVAIVVGSEGKGLRRLTQERCEKILSIPMAGNITSLNASVSFAVSAYEIFRQRKRIKKNLTRIN